MSSTGADHAPAPILTFGDYEIDFRRQELRRAGEPVLLQSTPLRLLLYLAAHRDRTVPKPELLDALWPDTKVIDTALSNALSQARKALGDDGTRQQVIRTQKRLGYRFIATVEERTRAVDSVAAPPSDAPFVGRESILERLDGALESAMSGSGRVVLLAGEPGIGKTRTAEEFARRARERGAVIYTGWCDESGLAPPYWPWVRLLRGVLRDRPADGLRSDLGPGAAVLSIILPELRERLPDLPSPPELGPDALRFQLSDALCTLLRSLAVQQPVAVVLDDLHRADEETLGVLRFLAREITREPILLLGAYRDVEVGKGHPLAETLGELTRQEGFERLPLRGLSNRDVGELVRRLSGRESSPELVETIMARSDGNPLFVTELGRALSDSGLDGGSPDSGVPRSLSEVILGRLGQLSATCNQVLTVASVLGRDISAELIEAVTDVDALRLDEVIQEARRAGMISAAFRGEPRFAHILVRDAIYDEIGPARRTALHRAIADALEQALPSKRNERAVLQLAHQRQYGGQRVEAARWYSRAASLLRGKSVRESYRCCLAGLAGLNDLASATRADEDRGAELIVLLARQALHAGSNIPISQEEATGIFKKALDALGAPAVGAVPSDPESSRELAFVHTVYSEAMLAWDAEDALRISRHAVELANRSGEEATRLHAVLTLAMNLIHCGQYQEAYQTARREIDRPPPDALIMSDLIDFSPFPRLLSTAATARAYAGDPEEALGLYSRAIGLLRRDGRPLAPEEVTLLGSADEYHGGSLRSLQLGYTVCDCVFHSVACYYFLGAAESAAKCARTYLEFVERFESPLSQALGNWASGLTSRLQRRWEDLARAAEGPEEHFRALQALPRAWQAEARAHLGEREAALAQATRLLAEEGLEWNPGALVSCAHTLVYCDGARRRDEIHSVFARIVGAIERTGARSYLPFLHELRAQLALVCGDQEGLQREREEAELLWLAMGAQGHVERMTLELEELRQQL